MAKKKKATRAQIDKIIKSRAKAKETKPLWAGPEDDGPQGGVTQSMMGSFACCRERFRIRNILGLRSEEGFRHALEYGNMWHLCEENYASGEPWDMGLRSYAQKLARLYPTQQEQVLKWYDVCRVQFSVYLGWWAKNDDSASRTHIAPEQIFKVSYQLPSGRIVFVRGKWDSIDLVKPKKGKKELFLFEHKTKGEINEEQLQHKQLYFDLQTMVYLSALVRKLQQEPKLFGRDHGLPKGFIYNVVRRPLSGGVGSIRPHKEKKNKNGVVTAKAETMQHFYERLGKIIEDSSETFFMRWPVHVSQADIVKFDHEYLTSTLEQMTAWYKWIISPEGIKDPFANPIHWRHPYGIYNPMDRGGVTDVDEYLRIGSTVGLVKVDRLFKELD